MERLEGFLGSSDEAAKRVFGEFLKSQSFVFGVQILRYFLLQESTERKISEDEFKAKLAGFFFSSIAYNTLNRELKEGDRLLSPQETEELYATLYPTKPKHNPYGLGLKMRKITIPDGILITEHDDRTELSGVYEHTLMNPRNPHKIPQFEHYRDKANVIADFTPTLPGPVREICFPGAIRSRFDLPAEVEVDPINFEVIFVFPRDDRMGLYSNIPGRVIFLPISRPQFRTVLDAVFMDTKNSLGLRVE